MLALYTAHPLLPRAVCRWRSESSLKICFAPDPRRSVCIRCNNDSDSPSIPDDSGINGADPTPEGSSHVDSIEDASPPPLLADDDSPSTAESRSIYDELAAFGSPMPSSDDEDAAMRPNAEAGGAAEPTPADPGWTPRNGQGEAAYSGSTGGGEFLGGSPEVQDALEEVMMLSIRKEKVKEEIRQDLEVKKERLRTIGEELSEQFAKEIELDKMRTELASNMSLAETMEKFQQLEDEVQAVRDKLKADKEELADWEEKTAAARNKGLFFKRLHKSSAKQGKMTGEASGGEEGDDAEEEGPLDLEDSETKRRILATIKEPASQEVNSPWRLYVFVYLSSVSMLVLTQDLLSDSPSFGSDALYAAITAALLWNIYSERRALQSNVEEKGDQGDPKP